MTLIEPIDRTHRECLAARDAIHAHAHRIRLWIHAWEPRPCPPLPTTTETRNHK